MLNFAAMIFAGIVALLAALTLAAVGWRSRALTIAVFCGYPLAMIFWPAPLDLQPFTWVKVLTLCFGMLLVDFLPGWNSQNSQGRAWVFYAFLALNIAEATANDAAHGRWIGAAIGATLILLQPGARAVRFPILSRRRTLAYDLPWSWIAAYTAWNAGFVCAAYPLHASDHLAVLGAPLAATFWAGDRGAWYRARALTLALYGCLVVGVIDMAHRPWLPAFSGSESVYPYLLAVAVCLLGWCAVDFRRQRSPQDQARTATAG